MEDKKLSHLNDKKDPVFLFFNGPWHFYQSHPKIVLLLIIGLGLFLRWWDLDTSRPIHHDESLHGMYSLYAFDRPDINFYKYQPLLHGPLLFNVIPWAMDLLGKTDFAIRFPMALMGSFLLFLPLLFRRYLSPVLLLFSTLFIALSPELVYWSRFSREDLFMVCSLILMLIGLTHSQQKLRPILFWIGFWLMMCVKESSFVMIAMAIVFIMVEKLFVCFSPLLQSKNYIPFFDSLKKSLTSDSYSWVLGSLIGFLIYALLYSAGFKHSEGILDGLYRKSILYWWEQHSIERIKGPFSYTFFTISWYDFPWLIALVLQQWNFYTQRAKYLKTYFALALLMSIALAYFMRGVDFESFALTHMFKLKIPFDLILCCWFLISAVSTPLVHAYEGKKHLAYWGYAFWANLFTYSYLGEKVPWLAMYPLLLGFAYMVLYAQDLLKGNRDFLERRWKISSFFKVVSICLGVFALLSGLEDRNPQMAWPFVTALLLYLLSLLIPKTGYNPSFLAINVLFSLLFLFSLRSTVMVNFGRSGEQHQFIGQVHTTWEMDRIARDIRQKALYATDKMNASIYLQGDALWPLTWYFRNLPRYRFVREEDSQLGQYDFAFLNPGDPQVHILKKTHHERLISLRGWWVPEYNQLSLFNFLTYVFFQREWNPIGNMHIHFFTKRIGT